MNKNEVNKEVKQNLVTKFDGLNLVGDMREKTFYENIMLEKSGRSVVVVDNKLDDELNTVKNNCKHIYIDEKYVSDPKKYGNDKSGNGKSLPECGSVKISLTGGLDVADNMAEVC
jgi:hypothetical protein